MVIEGIVVHGNSLGGRMGFPTANIEVDAALEVRDGVYASRAEVDGRMYDAMSNLGCKPTVDGRRRLLETNLFDFDGDLYGRRLRVELLRFIRPERRFGSVEELFRQIEADRRAIRGGKGAPSIRGRRAVAASELSMRFSSGMRGRRRPVSERTAIRLRGVAGGSSRIRLEIPAKIATFDSFSDTPFQ